MNAVVSNVAPKRRYSLPVVFTLGLLATATAQAFDSGSTGTEALNVTVSREIELPPSGILNYTTVNIPAGVTVTFRKNAANTPVFILASGDVTIAGTISIIGADAKPTGTYGDGVLGDDAIPGAGGPGGYDGGRGGRTDAAQTPAIVRGGAGLGPGGGPGGIEGADGCAQVATTGYAQWKYIGAGGAYAKNVFHDNATSNHCSGGKAMAFAYGSALLQPLVGGSGGGGGRGGLTYPGSGGGGGGGAILIASSGKITLAGAISAVGGDGGGVAGTGVGGNGAGGSGGAIRLVANTIAGAGGVYAAGGCINSGGSRRQSCGSDGANTQRGGSEGRIRFEADAVTFSGISQPAYSIDKPGSVFIASAPSLRIASVAGQAAPANPTGSADISLPASTTGPVTVTFETANVPVGNTVKLRVVPAYGTLIEALSPAIGGSAASGTTSVSVTLPAGPSVLQAATTYTVVVAGDLDLSRFAQNEKVDKVEITVALEGEPTARLLAASGKSYEISYAALRAAGFRG